MPSTALLDKITSLITPLLNSLDLELWGMEFTASSRGLLRVYIEKRPSSVSSTPDGASQIAETETAAPSLAEHTEQAELAGIDECSEASRLISLTLDVEDPINVPYVLEVSTPGLERIFFKPEQLAAWHGADLEVTLQEAAPGHPGRKKFTGKLLRAEPCSEDMAFTLSITEPLENEPPELTFSWNQVKKAKLVYVEAPNKFAPKQKKNGPGAKKKK